MKKKEELKPFNKYLECLINKYDGYTVFDDFLTVSVCALSYGQKEELYHKVRKRYTPDDFSYFVKAFSSITVQVYEEPLKDIFGDYFQEHFYDKDNGQFFTPFSVCDLMTALVGVSMADKENGNDKDKTVYDCACGSGRTLLSSAKVNTDRYFVGADISHICCKMTLINLCLNGLRGEVRHMNSLGSDIWCRWLVIADAKTNLSFIYEVQQDKENTPENKTVSVSKNIPVLPTVKGNYVIF